jgi:hypothetical protein
MNAALQVEPSSMSHVAYGDERDWNTEDEFCLMSFA